MAERSNARTAPFFLLPDRAWVQWVMMGGPRQRPAVSLHLQQECVFHVAGTPLPRLPDPCVCDENLKPRLWGRGSTLAGAQRPPVAVLGVVKSWT